MAATVYFADLKGTTRQNLLEKLGRLLTRAGLEERDREEAPRRREAALRRAGEHRLRAPGLRAAGRRAAARDRRPALPRRHEHALRRHPRRVRQPLRDGDRQRLRLVRGRGAGRHRRRAARHARRDGAGEPHALPRGRDRPGDRRRRRDRRHRALQGARDERLRRHAQELRHGRRLAPRQAEHALDRLPVGGARRPAPPATAAALVRLRRDRDRMWRGARRASTAERCSGCGACLPTCPVGAIRIDWNQNPGGMQERMAEYAYGAIAPKRDRAVFLNVLLQISPLCDCYPFADTPLVPDVGILASTDPVAIDQASADLVNAQPGHPLSQHTARARPRRGQVPRRRARGRLGNPARPRRAHRPRHARPTSW